MNLLRLILRGLVFYRRTGIVIALGIAVAVAVITGSLLVGASVTGSLRDTALAQLGRIEWAVTPPRYFHQELADEVQKNIDEYRRLADNQVSTAFGISRQPGGAGESTEAAALILTGGTVQNPDTDAVIPHVQLIGVDAKFRRFFPATILSELTGHAVAINSALAQDLHAHAGDDLIMHLDRADTMPAGSLFARWKRKDTLRTVRVTIAQVLPDAGAGGFTLNTGTAIPRNIFIARDTLQTVLGKQGKANTLVLHIPQSLSVMSKSAAGFVDTDEYNKLTMSDKEEMIASSNSTYAVSASCRLDDYGLKLVSNPPHDYLSLESDGMLLDRTTIDAANSAVADCGAPQATPTSVYLATEMRTATHGISYSLLAAANLFYPYVVFDARRGPMGKQDIWLNRWAADDLQAHVGDRLRVSYLIPNRDGTYRTATMPLTIARILEMDDPLVDAGLVPEIDGVSNSSRIDDWATPFPIDMKRVTKRDEQYWTRYRTTPKAIISQEAMQQMWAAGGSAQWVTSLRIVPHLADNLPTLERKFSAALLKRLDMQSAGLAPRPVRQLALEAAKGSTDFGQLFLGMSFFLMLAAAGLAGMLMRLLAERRATEVGLLQACGWNRWQIALAVRGEGFALTVIGTLAGVPLGVLYAWGTMHALATWWVDAVGHTTLWLHIDLLSLLIGALSGLLIGHFALGWGTRQLQRTPLLRLLAGWQAMSVTPSVRGNRIAVSLLITALVTAGGLTVYAVRAGSQTAATAFFGVGTALLLAGLCAGYLLLNRQRGGNDVPTLARMALWSAAANRGRSLLTIGLLAAAAFIIVAVAANARDYSHLDIHNRQSGAGGFALKAESSLPMHVDFRTPAGRKNLGFSPEDERLFDGVTIYPFLLSPGDDISCLNLAHAHAPRVLGVSEAMIARGGFNVHAATPSHADDLWSLLDTTGGNRAQPAEQSIQAFGDEDSVNWNLNTELGHNYRLAVSNGSSANLRFTGLLPGSIFAGELLVSEKNFKQLYPDVTAPRYFLLDTPPGREEAVAAALRRNLGEMGLEVRGTRELLSAYLGVQNTYLSTFLALGGLGLLLGTLGLVTLLLRGALERRREFALMLATGFRREELTALLVWENAGLLIAGLLLGTVSALVAIIPQLLSAETHINWLALAALLVATLVVSLPACILAARAATSGKLLEALRGE